MNFFAQELDRICEESEYIHDPKYIGRACVFRLSDDITGKMEFVERGCADNFTALKLSLYNRREGRIDCHIVSISDIIGTPILNGRSVTPRIWRDGNNASWYSYKPLQADYTAMAETADDYLSCFAEPEMAETQTEGLSIDLE